MSELSELFARDPLNLTEADIRTIIERMRLAQSQFELGLKSPVADRKAAKKARAKDLLTDLGLDEGPKGDDLKDLGL